MEKEEEEEEPPPLLLLVALPLLPLEPLLLLATACRARPVCLPARSAPLSTERVAPLAAPLV
jgi:hypothetical protein